VGSGHGDLSGIQQPRFILAQECTDEHAVGDTGDEVLDIFRSGERRQGLLKGLVGRNPGDDGTIARVPSLTAGEFPHFATVSHSGVFQAGLESGGAQGAER